MLSIQLQSMLSIAQPKCRAQEMKFAQRSRTAELPHRMHWHSEGKASAAVAFDLFHWNTVF